MTNTYILTSKRLTGHIEVQYTDGILTAVKTLLKDPLNEAQFQAFKDKVPMMEQDLTQLKLIGLQAEKEAGPNAKLALFCRLYQKHKGVKYEVSRADSGKVKLVKFDEPMLEHYFASDNFLFKGKQCISNLVKYYNELRADMATPKKSKYPDHYSKEFENRLKDGEHKLYWAHLRSLGMIAKKDQVGNTIDWIRIVQ